MNNVQVKRRERDNASELCRWDVIICKQRDISIPIAVIHHLKDDLMHRTPLKIMLAVTKLPPT